jgi:hypothetical protein
VLILPLAIIFGISVVIFFYIASYSWFVSAPSNQSAPWLYSSAVASGTSLFLLSNIVYSRRKSLSISQRILLSFFDLGSFFCASVVVLWGLIFPILRPIGTPDFPLYLLGQKSLVIGLYTGLILCTIVVVFRVSLQFLLVRSLSSGVIVPVAQPVLAQQSDNSDKKSLEDSLSSIHTELIMLREEMSSLRLSKVWSPRGGAVRVESSGDPSGWAGDVKPISFPVSQLPVSPISTPIHPITLGNLVSNAGSQVPVAIPPENERATGSFQLPDSAIGNPWMSVLSGRQTRAMPVKPIEVEVIPSIPEIPEPLPPEILPQSPVEIESGPPVSSEIPVSNPIEIVETEQEFAAPSPVDISPATSGIEPPNIDDVLLPNPIEFAEPKPEVTDLVPVPASSIVGKSPEETDFVVPVSFEEMEAKIIEDDKAPKLEPIEIIAPSEDIAVPKPAEAPEIAPPESTEILETKPLQEEPAAEAKPVELEPSLAEIMVWKPEISEPSEIVVPVPPVEVPPAASPEVPEPTPVENVVTTPPEGKKAKSTRRPRKTKSTKNGKSSTTRSN